MLYRVDPVSGASRIIDVVGRDLTSGDSLELRGDQLYVVNGRFGTLASQPDAEVYLTRLRLR